MQEQREELKGQLSLLDELAPIGRTLPARATDPETSHEAARAVTLRAGTLRHRLLAAYVAQGFPMTDEEAAEHAGVARSGYWKRCSELRDGGFIEPVKDEDGRLLTREGSSGVQQMLCRATAAGREALT